MTSLGARYSEPAAHPTTPSAFTGDLAMGAVSSCCAEEQVAASTQNKQHEQGARVSAAATDGAHLADHVSAKHVDAGPAALQEQGDGMYRTQVGRAQAIVQTRPGAKEKSALKLGKPTATEDYGFLIVRAFWSSWGCMLDHHHAGQWWADYGCTALAPGLTTCIPLHPCTA